MISCAASNGMKSVCSVPSCDPLWFRSPSHRPVVDGFTSVVERTLGTNFPVVLESSVRMPFHSSWCCAQKPAVRPGRLCTMALAKLSLVTFCPLTPETVYPAVPKVSVNPPGTTSCTKYVPGPRLVNEYVPSDAVVVCAIRCVSLESLQRSMVTPPRGVSMPMSILPFELTSKYLVPEIENFWKLAKLRLSWLVPEVPVMV